MLPPLYSELPCVVTVEGLEYPIITDFREWIRLLDLARDDELSTQEKCALMMEWFTSDIPCDISSAIDALAAFAKCEVNAEDRNAKSVKENEKGQQVFSFGFDADAIIIGFMQVYHIDLYDIKYLHWWKFKSLLDGLPEETEFKQRIHYRTVNLAEIKESKERQRVAKIKRKVALPSSELREISDEDIGSAFW